MSFSTFKAGALALTFFYATPMLVCGRAGASTEKSQSNSQTPPKSTAPKQPAPVKEPTSEEELQLAIGSAGSDRATLVRNLEAFLKEYPEAPNRVQIYRALVEASLQLRDNARAADYAERIVALNPNDISITLLTIQLLERQSNEASLRRAVTYATRVLDYVNGTASSQRSPRVSEEQWNLEKKTDQASTLFLRGDIYLKLKDFTAAQQDFQTSYQLLPGAGAAERLGEIAELKKDWNTAITEYALAFALAEGKSGNVSRKEIRQKLGNVWRMAHRSDDGLGDYLLRTYDEVSQLSGTAKPKKNAQAREISEFTVRKAPEGTTFPLRDTKGKVLVLNFWATWCGPCHALEPQFARVAMEFQGFPDVLFLAANCDEDETLVAPYLEEDKPHTAVVFADGLDRLFAVKSYPTVLVIDRDGTIAYRSDGFSPETFEQDLAAAVRRTLVRTDATVPANDPAR
jgi:thiol-disulfide isomerase/thioredoxin/regulator of sirC expression with transglutaminase-like and TPR domain